MLSGRELMIGDWVHVITSEREAAEFRALKFPVPEPRDIQVGAIMPFAGIEYEYDYFYPIPITESFILKNFQPRYKDIYELTTLWGIRPFHDHWQVCLLTMDEFGGGSWEGAFEVKYVHEVQQFLRLLKVGKEVVV